jgi:hypothetical protein
MACVAVALSLSSLAPMHASRVRFPAAGAAAVSAAPAHGVPATQPDLWLCAAHMETLGRADQWNRTAQSVDTVKLYIDAIPATPIAQLRALVTTLNGLNIKIAVEMAGLADWHAGDGNQAAELSFQDEWLKVQPLVLPVAQGGAGGTLSYVEFDGPVRRMLFPNGVETGQQTLASATDELVDAVRLWTAAAPGVRVHLLTNFPNWGWKGEAAYHNFGYSAGPLGYGDYFTVVTTAIRKCAFAGHPLSGVTCDNPYDYALGEHYSNQPAVTAGINWMRRIRDLEHEVELRGLDFCMIYNSERAGESGTGSNLLFERETLAYMDWHCAADASPRHAIVQSWYPHPTANVPETTPGTLTHLGGHAAGRLQAGCLSTP